MEKKDDILSSSAHQRNALFYITIFYESGDWICNINGSKSTFFWNGLNSPGWVYEILKIYECSWIPELVRKKVWSVQRWQISPLSILAVHPLNTFPLKPVVGDRLSSAVTFLQFGHVWTIFEYESGGESSLDFACARSIAFLGVIWELRPCRARRGKLLIQSLSWSGTG